MCSSFGVKFKGEMLTFILFNVEHKMAKLMTTESPKNNLLVKSTSAFHFSVHLENTEPHALRHVGRLGKSTLHECISRPFFT